MPYRERQARLRVGRARRAANRIHEVLDAQPEAYAWTDSMALQTDDMSLPARRIQGVAGGAAKASANARRALELLRGLGLQARARERGGRRCSRCGSPSSSSRRSLDRADDPDPDIRPLMVPGAVDTRAEGMLEEADRHAHRRIAMRCCWRHAGARRWSILRVRLGREHTSWLDSGASCITGIFEHPLADVLHR
jgi:hypothetical protein